MNNKRTTVERKKSSKHTEFLFLIFKVISSIFALLGSILSGGIGLASSALKFSSQISRTAGDFFLILGIIIVVGALCAIAVVAFVGRSKSKKSSKT